MAGGSPPRGACWGGEGRRDPRACPRSPARGRQPRRRGDGPSLAGRGGQSGAAPAPPRCRSGPELTERGSRDGGQGSGSLEDKTPRFSRSDELLWGRGAELPSPPLPAADEWARRMDSPECVISSSNCETPPFTNNLSQLYRTHTETKGKPLPCSLPLSSPVRKGFMRAGSTGEGGSRRRKLSSAAARPLPPRLPQEPPPEGPRPPRSGTSPAAEPGPSLPAAGARAGCAHGSRGRASRGHPGKLAASSARFLVRGGRRPGAGRRHPSSLGEGRRSDQGETRRPPPTADLALSTGVSLGHR